jgi:RNA recognition motif-containing protein
MPSSPKHNRRLLVENLPKSFHDGQLRHMFFQYGDVVEARVVIDVTSGESLGFGFVEMSTEAEAARAREELNYRMVGPSHLLVIPAST